MEDRKVLFRSKFTVDWERTPIVEGEVVELGHQEVDGRDAEFMVVDTQDGLCTVFRSAGLEDLWEHVQVGVNVKVEYLRTLHTRNNRDFRQFRSMAYLNPGKPVPVVDPVVGKRTRSTRKPRP